MGQVGASRDGVYGFGSEDDDRATVPIDLAATQLPELFARAEAGEEVVIANGTRGGMKLVPTAAPPPVLRPRLAGTLGPIGDEEAEEAVRSLPKEYWGYIGDDDD